MENILQQYAELKLQKQTIESQIELLQPQVVQYMNDNNIEKAETPLGSFAKSMYKKWTYSDKVKDLSEKLKIAQVKEQQQGIAHCDITSTIRFTAVKL